MLKFNPLLSLHDELYKEFEVLISVFPIIDSIGTYSLPNRQHFWSASVLDHQIALHLGDSVRVEELNRLIYSLLQEGFYELQGAFITFVVQNKYQTHDISIACPIVVLLVQLMQLFHSL